MPTPFYTCQSEVFFDKSKNEIKLIKRSLDEEVKILLKYKLLNDNLNLRIVNATYTVLKLLRNGMIIFALYFVIALYQKGINNEKSGSKSKSGHISFSSKNGSIYTVRYHYTSDKKVDIKFDTVKVSAPIKKARTKK